MAEEIKTPETPVQAAAPVAETPVIAESALGPEIKSEPVKATETPVETKPIEAPEAKVEAPKVEAEKPAEVKAEVKPEEKKPEIKAEEKPAEIKVEAKPAEMPKFDAFTLPEGVKLEDKQVGEIHSMLGNFEIASKSTHAEVQKFGQAIVEYGLGVVKDAIAQTQKQADEYWTTKTREFREAFEKDPEIGGPKKEATTEAARQFIAQHAGTPEQVQNVRKLLWDHKLADHPDIIRLFANANLARGEAKPLPAQKAVTSRTSKLDRMYGNMKE